MTHKYILTKALIFLIYKTLLKIYLFFLYISQKKRKQIKLKTLNSQLLK